MQPELEGIASSPALAEMAARLFHAAGAENAPESIRDFVVAQISAAMESDCVAVVRAEKGKWTTLAATDSSSLPLELLAESLDQAVALTQGDWSVAPLEQQAAFAELLAIRAAKKLDDRMEVLPAIVSSVLRMARQRERESQRIRRLEAILEIAAAWGQTQEMNDLLNQMAETSTKLLGAERASIFLWDRRNKQLVGRPALGVEGNELRISETTGIVGQVVQTGENRRVDADEDQREIDRSVDKKLHFETRSLLCVPLRGSDGKLLGAFEMINKIDGNFTGDDEAALVELASHAAVALENTQQTEQLLKTQKHMADHAAEGVQLIGECDLIEALRNTVRKVANTELAILILGENGTGKEVVSQQIHYLSRRRNEPFIAVNCAALTETLLESELFGHEKGAFTDARETRVGKFELASGGTLFLDEIGDMSLGGQAKMLRVLEEKVVVRVGGSQSIHTDARVIAATNQNLGKMVREKKFREDLFFRLNVVSIDLPPLRERGEDILLLAEHFLGDFCAKARRKPPKFTSAARRRLIGHSWPGNVRELRNLMERLAYLSAGEKVDVDELAFILAPGSSDASAMSLDASLTDATRVFQSEYIKKHIERARGNMTDAAKRLGLHRSNLYRKMRQLGMDGAEDPDE